MKAVSPYEGTVGSGEPQEPRWTEVPDPVLEEGEVLVEVKAAALNRGDLLQMRGLYPPPAGASPVPGLEAAGVVLDCARGGQEENGGFTEGDEVVALLAGGGQAQRVAVPAGQLLLKPKELTWAEAGGLAEVALTSWTNLVHEGGLARGQSVLITAAASGVGSYAVQVARELGARIIVAGRKLHRLEPLLEMGAHGAVALGPGIAEEARALVPGGVDLVIDLVGGPGVSDLLGALKNRGRLVLLGLLGGLTAELPLGEILRRRLEIRGSVLRSRSTAEKRGLIRSFEAFAQERWAAGGLTPIIDRSMPFERVADAYRALATEEVFGKIVLTREVE